MKNNSLYLPGFHLSKLRRKPRSAAHKLADSLAYVLRHSISSLGECFGQFIPSKVLENEDVGSFSRRRLFSKTNTFWAFFSQVLDADGGNVRRLTHNPGDDWSPAWTPDGTQITFLWGPNNHAEIYIINVDGTSQQLLGDFIGEASGDLDWSPSGERLLFTSQGNGHPEQTFELNMKTKVVRQLIFSHKTSLSANASWAPSGEYIVFTSDRYGPLDIFRMALDGSNVRRLTHSPERRTGSWAFAQSPDGSHIVFSSDRMGDATEFRGNMEIYVTDADGLNLRRITTNQWMDAHPDW